MTHFGQQAPESLMSQLQNGVSTSSLPPFIVNLLTFSFWVNPRSNSFFQCKFLRVLNNQFHETAVSTVQSDHKLVFVSDQPRWSQFKKFSNMMEIHRKQTKSGEILILWNDRNLSFKLWRLYSEMEIQETDEIRRDRRNSISLLDCAARRSKEGKKILFGLKSIFSQ